MRILSRIADNLTLGQSCIVPSLGVISVTKQANEDASLGCVKAHIKALDPDPEIKEIVLDCSDQNLVGQVYGSMVGSGIKTNPTPPAPLQLVIFGLVCARPKLSQYQS
jgi:hypothetical protein